MARQAVATQDQVGLLGVIGADGVRGARRPGRSVRGCSGRHRAPGGIEPSLERAAYQPDDLGVLDIAGDGDHHRVGGVTPPVIPVDLAPGQPVDRLLGAEDRTVQSRSF